MSKNKVHVPDEVPEDFSFDADTSDLRLPTLSVSAAIAQFKHLQGKVLTVIDSVIPEGQQNKAIKDTIKMVFGIQMDHVYDMGASAQRMRANGANQLCGSDCIPGVKAEVMVEQNYETIETPDEFLPEK